MFQVSSKKPVLLLACLWLEGFTVKPAVPATFMGEFGCRAHSLPPGLLQDQAGTMMDTRSAHKTVIRPSYNELATLSCNRQQAACADGDMGKCADSLLGSTRHAHTDIIDDRDPETKQVSGRETSTGITDIGRGEVCYNNELGASPPRD